jgi:hypothetical protein
MMIIAKNRKMESKKVFILVLLVVHKVDGLIPASTTRAAGIVL